MMNREELITDLQTQLGRALRSVISLMREEAQKILWGYLDCESLSDTRHWRNIAAREIIQLAEAIPKELFHSSNRAYCPLCKDGALVLYESGFKLPEGLRGFVDRPIGDRGPFRIRFETVANAQLKQKLHGSAVDSSPTAAERYPDVQTIPAYLRDPNHYWRFYISNPNSTFFMATGNGFWRPGIELVRPADSIRDKDDRHLLIQKKPE